MMRIDIHESTNTMTMRIQGRFVSKFAEDAKVLIAQCKKLPKLVVNLSEVSFVDSAGEEVLCRLGQIGGEFVAENSYSIHICERLHLPMAEHHPRSLSRRLVLLCPHRSPDLFAHLRLVPRENIARCESVANLVWIEIQ